jgi:hypothetical protein
MPTLDISESPKLQSGDNGVYIPAFDLDAGVVSQNVTFAAGVSTPAVPCAGNTRVVRLLADAACTINVNAAATATSLSLAANISECFTITKGATIHVRGV